MSSSIFSDDDREAWKQQSLGSEEQQHLAEQVAPEIVANIKEFARNQFRTYGIVSMALGSDNSPRNEHSPYIPPGVLENAVRPLIRDEFSLPDHAFSLTIWLGDGDYIKGTYEEHYRNKISARVDFNPPLK